MHILEKFHLNFKDRTDIILTLVLVVSIAVGLIIRLNGLGKWALALDEYYTVESAKNILKYGVPMWDSGGFYMRGILMKYITALFLWVGFEAEYGSRLITVIANMLAIPPLFILAKKISGKIFATVLVVIFCFSVWEAEFARFARMYAPFQAIFLWYLLFLYKNIIEGDLKTWKWLFLLSFISIFIHESGIFIVVLNFFPIIWTRKIRVSKLIISFFILIISYYYLTFNFWNLNLQNVMPADIVYEGTDFTHEGYLRTPDLLINFISFQNIFWWLLIVLFVFSMFVTIKLFKEKEIIFLGKIILTISLVLSFLNLLALAIIVLLLGLLLDWIKLSLINNKVVRNFIAVIFLVSFYWLLFIFISDSWYSIFPDDIISSSVDIEKREDYCYLTILLIIMNSSCFTRQFPVPPC